jgi:hypothetical protein
MEKAGYYKQSARQPFNPDILSSSAIIKSIMVSEKKYER